MNNGRNLTLALFGIVWSMQSGFAAAVNPQEVMKKNDDARRITDFETVAKLSSGTVGQTEGKVKEFTLWRKIQKDGIHNSTLTRFHSPAEVRNEGILIVENASSRNDVLMYLPNFKKVRRVESQQQSGSFMGSVFSYSDIATPHVEDYTYKLLKEEKCPAGEAAAVNCEVIECTPANDDIKERTGYAKSVLWIRDDNFMGVHAEYYDLENGLFKKMDMSETKLVDPKNKKWLAHLISITNLKSNEFTKLQFSNVKVNSNISDSTFTAQNLQTVH